ncbi:MAG TPA: hypothetical protein VIJ28_00125 [Chloroflexota bacterium]
MQQRPRSRGQEDATSTVAPVTGPRNVLPMGITVAILGVMTLAIAIDTSSVPGLSFFAIFSLGALIGAIIIWG